MNSTFPAPHRRSPASRWAVAAVWLCALALVACEDGPDDGSRVATFAAALPTFDLLEVDPPTVTIEAAPLAPGLGLQPAALAGDRADLRANAYAAMTALNDAMSQLTRPIADIVRTQDPTFSTEDRAIWRGTERRDGGDELMLIVQRQEAGGHFTFSGVSRAADSASGWRWRFFGEMTPSDDPGRGRGAIFYDFDADHDPDTQGQVLATWSEIGDQRDIAASLYGVTLRGNTPKTQQYNYTRRALGVGKFDFGPFAVDIHAGLNDKDALERAASVTRWNAVGVGRTDIVATGGDIEVAGFQIGLISECWTPDSPNTTYEAVFRRRTSTGPFAKITDSGDRDLCPFESPAIASARTPGDAPMTPALPVEAREPLVPTQVP